jgi:flagellar biosynthesis protein FlhB
VLAFERVKPKLENMNPAAGIKRMFTLDNLVEVVKALLKTAMLVAIAWRVLCWLLPRIATARAGLSGAATSELLAKALWQASLMLAGATIAVFVLVAALDAAWQRHSFMKKMRMSRRDIRQELKDTEGDPLIKSQRRQTHLEWAERNALQAAKQADVLIVNPTHVAIALRYDETAAAVPVVSGKGEDAMARAMRAAAEDDGVPIVRNVGLARELLAGTETGAIVPAHLFDVVAEVVLWAREVREELERRRRGDATPSWARERLARVPGEDATRYPGRSSTD